MKITMYELLGMVKDGKAPKKIKCYGYIFEYDTNHLRYESYFDEQIWTLNDFVSVDDSLNDEVEILEEDKKENEIPNINLDNMKDIGAKVGKAYRELFEGFNKGWNTPLEEEKKIPEKITINENGTLGFPNGEWTGRNMDKAFAMKINFIIDYLKSKGE